MGNSDSEDIKKVGRPKIDVDDYFAKIQPYLQLGYSLHKACLYAEIPYRQLHDYYVEDEDFRNRVERERTLVNAAARRNLVEAIKKGDIKASMEWLETQEKDDFSKRTEVEHIEEKENEELKLLREIVDSHENTNGNLLPTERKTN